jgi:hypothetical protein
MVDKSPQKFCIAGISRVKYDFSAALAGSAAEGKIEI